MVDVNAVIRDKFFGVNHGLFGFVDEWRVLALSVVPDFVEFLREDLNLVEPVVVGPVADRSSAYVGVETDDGGALHALALDGGTVRWTLTFDRPPGTPTVVDDALLVPVRGGDDGERLVVLTGP